MKQTGIELYDYVAILKRRKFHFIIPFVVVMTISISLALLLPAVYRSEGTILVERAEMPEELVDTTVTGYVQERIEAVKQRIFTRDNLVGMAEKRNLYPELFAEERYYEIAKEMANSAYVEMLDVQATSPSATRQALITIAFTVAFEAGTPGLAKDIANELVFLFLDENRKSRTEQSSEVAEFLDEEEKKLAATIKRLEKQMADFKQDQLSQLPEQIDINNRMLEKTENQLAQTEESIRALKNAKNEVEAQLLVTDKHVPVTDERGQRVLSPMGRLVQARYDLAAARQKYSAIHPDVKKLEQLVKTLEEEVSNNSPDSDLTAELMNQPTNPQYIQMQSELETLAVEIRANLEKKARYEKQKAEYEERLFMTPVVARDYALLEREHQSARAQYNDIKAKQLQAKLAIELEREQKGGSFTLVDPPYLPREPIRPNRLGIFLIGFLFATSAGLGLAFVAEYSDKSIRGVKGIQEIFNAPPIGVIPRIEANALALVDFGDPSG
jgi:polysaccharide chain length determinant protein (PEP-CTERM system associated)